VQAGDNNFDKEVMRYPGVAIVVFYAPWCGHCKQLAPAYEMAARILNGVVKFVSVDATVHQGLAQKYGTTIKVFGADKKKPTDYNANPPRASRYIYIYIYILMSSGPTTRSFITGSSIRAVIGD